MDAAPSVHDVIVVGGGVTGAAVARDLALRGVSVLLVDKDDWGGNSGPSTSTLHGGASYLEFDWESWQPALEDTTALVRIARHMVRRTAFLVPVLPDHSQALAALEAALDDYDRLQTLSLGHPHVRLSGVEARRLEPGLSPDIVAAIGIEEWHVDPRRLAWSNVLDALRAGARALNHCAVEALIRDGGAVIGARYRTPDGQRVEARARVVVVAAGAWARQVAALAEVELRLRATKRVHLVFDRRLSSFGIAAEAIDGRRLALVPQGALTFLGATEDDLYGDPEALEIVPDEVDYLRQAVERVFPVLGSCRALGAAASVRAMPMRWPARAGELPQRYEVLDHEARDGVPGLVTLVGGTLGTHRLAAEATADAVCARLGVQARSSTAQRHLPGAAGAAPTAAELARDHRIPLLAATRLIERHGCEAPEVLHDERRGRLVCRCESLTEAELAHAARHEQVRTLADAFRRLGLAAGPCAGSSCIERASEVVGRELGWSPGQRREAAREHVMDAWRGRAPALDRWGWAQEELAYGARRGWPGGSILDRA